MGFQGCLCDGNPQAIPALEPVVTCCWSVNVYVWHMALAGDSWQREWEEGVCLPESYGACLSSLDNVFLGAH